MATVPIYNGPQVAQTTGPGVRLENAATPAALSTGAESTASFGKAITDLGTTGANIEVDQMEAANNVRVTDALNQARQKAMDLTYNPETGYANLKGINALKRPDGKALPDEYAEKLGQNINDINASLSNDAQRRAFGVQSQQVLSSFHGDVEKHMLGEFQGYSASVAKGSGELAVQEATTNWNQPDKIDTALNGYLDPETNTRTGGLKQSIYQQAQVSGMSALEATAASNNAVSNVHAKVIEAALQNNNATYAMDYFSKNKSAMQADDILKVQGQVNTKMDSSMATTAVNNTTQKYTSAFMPNDMDRLNTIVMGNESGGKRYGPDGKTLLTSPAGAKGEMQVLDGTNTDPGFGVTPAKDDSPEERARVGRDYLGAMVKRYGNVPQALAAYNAGPGKVDDAIAAANEDKTGATNWLNKLPKETQAYVASGQAKFQSGSGTAQLPTKFEFVNDAVTQLGKDPRPEALTMAREQAEKQYDLLDTSRKEMGQQAKSAAQQALIQNGGNFSALDPKTVSDLSRYDPGAYDDALKFAKSINKGENMVTNMDAYATAVTYPADLAKMSDPDFLQFLKTNFSLTDQEKIAKMRAEQINGTTDNSINSINTTALNTTLTGRLAGLGIAVPKSTSTKSGDLEKLARVGSIQKFVRDDIYEQQKQIGHKLSPEEIEGRVDTLFTKSVDLPGVLWGSSEKNLISMKAGDIPGITRNTISKQLEANGIKNPSDDMVLEVYRRRMMKGQVANAQ